MSLFKRVRHVFNRVATKGTATVSAAVLSLGLGYTAMNSMEQFHETAPPVASVEMHDAAAAQVRQMGADILARQEALDFNKRALDQAQHNIGLNGGPLATQLDGLKQAQERQARDEQAQLDRLAQYRKALWFNPALSEKEADKLYTGLFYAARDKFMHNITNYFSPMTDALTFRDEIISQRNLPRDPAKISDEAAEQAVQNARGLDDANDAAEVAVGLAAALGGGLIPLALLWPGFRGRRREDEAPKPALLQDNTPLREEPEPPAKMPAGPSKFSL